MGVEVPNHESDEQNAQTLGSRLNWLRAGVLGANDGIVSVAGIVVGVAGATSSLSQIITAGLAGMVAGALSMAGGEYVSVSTQRDTEMAALSKEKWELENQPESEQAELTQLYRDRGLSELTAQKVAQELTERDALRAHTEVELHLDPDALINPWNAALASFVSFAIGASIPMVAILFPIPSWRVVVCFLSVIVGLVITGYVSARLGRANPRPAIVRNVGVGAMTMVVTWGVGRLFNVATG